MGYAGAWNGEEALRRINAIEARTDRSGLALPAAGDFFGQKFYVIPTSKWYAWNGTTWDLLN